MLEAATDPHSISGHESHAALSVDVLPGSASIVVPDAHLLFSGDFKRAGGDLILSDARHEFIVRDYFRGEERPTLLSPEGAHMLPDTVEAMTGHGSYAQAASSPANTSAIARVATIEGDATVIRNGVTVGLNVGDAIVKGDVLQTGNGALGVTFYDGSTLNLTANARLVVNDFVFDPHGASNSEILNLVQGALTFVSGEVAHNGNMKITTPVATMGIRGTVGGITDANDGTVQFYVVQSNLGAIITDSNGSSIAQVVQDGPLIVVHPVGPLQIVAEEVQKSPAELANEIAALQTIMGIKAIGDQIIQQYLGPNPQSTGSPHTQIEFVLPATFASHINSDDADLGVTVTTDNDNNTTVTVAKQITGLTTYQDFSNLPPVITGVTSHAVSNVFLSAVAAAYLTDGHDLVNTLGGTTGFGSVVNYLPDYTGIGGPRTDDGSTAAIDITSVFGPAGLNFFGTTYDSLYINNNGNVTFAGPNSAYIPGLPISSLGNPIIAPFWADVDTRGGPIAANTGGNSAGTNLVYYSLDPTNHVVTITWDDVGFYNEHTNPVDAFQVQLIGLGDGNFDIVFRYESINWVSGNVSGGVAASAGFSAGDNNPDHTLMLAESGNLDALLALPSTPGNTGIDGVDVFQVSSGGAAETLTVNGQIQFVDPNAADSHVASIVADAAGYIGSMSLEDPANNHSHVTESNGTTPGTVTWDLSVTPTDLAAIPVDQTITQSYNLMIVDNRGGVTAQAISVSIGGPGNDNFVFSANQHLGADTIANFNTTLDTIELDGYNAINNANLAAAITSNGADASHGDAVINLGHGDSITVANVTESYLQQHLSLIHLNSGVV